MAEIRTQASAPNVSTTSPDAGDEHGRPNRGPLRGPTASRRRSHLSAWAIVVATERGGEGATEVFPVRRSDPASACTPVLGIPRRRRRPYLGRPGTAAAANKRRPKRGYMSGFPKRLLGRVRRRSLRRNSIAV